VASGVLVATARALRYHGGASLEAAEQADVDRLREGLPNLARHIENLRALSVEPVVALNRFPGDAAEEIRAVEAFCEGEGVAFAPSTAFADGGAGALGLAEHVEAALEAGGQSRPIYAWTDPLERKLDGLVRTIYGGAGVRLEPAARDDLAAAEALGVGVLPVCVSKTPFSLSDDSARLGRPEGFTVRVDRVEVRAGAGYTVVYLGKVTTMPGLPPHPAAESIDLTPEGEIVGVR
jgi:formate--tetrahydrofolate ligase